MSMESKLKKLEINLKKRTPEEIMNRLLFRVAVLEAQMRRIEKALTEHGIGVEEIK
jgi:hypothetical protein